MGMFSTSSARAFLVLVSVISLWHSQIIHVDGLNCGTRLFITPNPVIGMGALTKTVSRQDTTPGPTTHLNYNADGTCLDSYNVLVLDYLESDITKDDEWTLFKGAEVYQECTGNSPEDTTVHCTATRMLVHYNPRHGAWKDTMLDTTPNKAYSAPAAAPLTSFSLSILSGTYGFLGLTGMYTFEMAVSSHRECVVREQSFSGGQITITDSALTVTVTSLPVGVYSICMRVTAGFFPLAEWFPLSASLGHSVHNLAPGVPATDAAWTVTPVTGDRLQYSESVAIVAERSIIDDGWVSFGLDTSADVCSPLLYEAFTAADLTDVNATHVTATFSVLTPYGTPAGGQAVLCGSRGTSEPWQLISTQADAPWFYSCAEGTSFALRSVLAQPVCASCPPPHNPCSGAGLCTLTVENKTQQYYSHTCNCFDRFYGTQCQYYELDPPSFSHENGTYTAWYIDVAVNATLNMDFLTRMELSFSNGTVVNCFSMCTVRITSNVSISTLATHVNGSQSPTTTDVSYVMLEPTPTMTFSETLSSTMTSSNSVSQSPTSSVSPSDSVSLSESLSLSPSESRSATSTVTLSPTMSPTRTETVSFSSTATTSSTQSLTATTTLPETPTETITESSSLSPTGSDSDSVTRSQTKTSSPTASNSLSGSASLSTTFSVTPTSTKSQSGTASELLTATSSTSTTRSQSQSSTAILTPSSSHSASVTQVVLPSTSETLSQSVTPSQSKSSSSTSSESLSQSETLSGSKSPSSTMSESLSRSGTVSGSKSPSWTKSCSDVTDSSSQTASNIQSLSQTVIPLVAALAGVFKQNNSMIFFGRPNTTASFIREGQSFFPSLWTVVGECSYGLSPDVPAMTVSLEYVSHNEHSCRVTVESFEGQLVTYFYIIAILPTQPEAHHLWLDGRNVAPRIIALTKYRAASVPYDVNQTKYWYGDCGRRNIEWKEGFFHVERSLVCLAVRVEGPGFFTVVDDVVLEPPKVTRKLLVQGQGTFQRTKNKMLTSSNSESMPEISRPILQFPGVQLFLVAVGVPLLMFAAQKVLL